MPRQRASPSGRQGLVSTEQALKEGTLQPPGSHAKKGKRPPSRQSLPHSHSVSSKRRMRMAALGSTGPSAWPRHMPARIEQSCLSPCGVSRANSFSLVFLVSNRCGRLEVWWTFFIPKMMSSTSWEKIVISALCQDRMHL